MTTLQQASPADQQAWIIYIIAQAISPIYYYAVQRTAFDSDVLNTDTLD